MNEIQKEYITQYVDALERQINHSSPFSPTEKELKEGIKANKNMLVNLRKENKKRRELIKSLREGI